MRGVAVVVAILWAGQAAAALACAVSCAPAGHASDGIERAAQGREATHQHHDAAVGAESPASNRPADMVIVPLRHPCHEANDPAVTVATAAAWRLDKPVRIATSVSCGFLEPVGTAARVSGRHEIATSPPRSTSQPFVLRI